MPIRAKLNGIDILAFEYDQSEWKSLKGKELTMPCCGQCALAKTSILGTQFFAHKNRANCSSSGETPEHNYLKSQVAEAAKRSGFRVSTEFRGETPSGKEWVADVYCEKGKAKIAVEIQWSNQSKEETQRRSGRYSESGVKVMWLYRIGARKIFWAHDYLQSTYELPIFYFQVKSQSVEKSVVCQFDVPLLEFIGGMLSGDLKWLPKPARKLELQPFIKKHRCQKCGRTMFLITGIEIHPVGELFNLPHLACAKELILFLTKYGIKRINEHQGQVYYITDGNLPNQICPHCGTKEPYPDRGIIEYTPKSELEKGELINIRYNESIDSIIKPEWYFKGKKALDDSLDSKY